MCNRPNHLVFLNLKLFSSVVRHCDSYAKIKASKHIYGPTCIMYIYIILTTALSTAVLTVRIILSQYNQLSSVENEYTNLPQFLRSSWVHCPISSVQVHTLRKEYWKSEYVIMVMFLALYSTIHRLNYNYNNCKLPIFTSKSSNSK